MAHAYRFFVDRKITAKGGGDHVRVIDVAVDDALVADAALAGKKLTAPPGESGQVHDDAAAALAAARKVADTDLKKGEEITSVSSILLDDVPPNYGIGLPV